MKKSLSFIVVPWLATNFLFFSPYADSKPRKIEGKQIFQQYCASCHLDGGNTVKPGKPVSQSTQLSAFVKFKDYLSAPPGHMPFYQELMHDDAALTALYNYCKTLKKQPGKQASNTHLE